MSALQAAKKAYSSASNPIATPSGTEYEVFGRITRSLQSLTDDTPADFARMVATLHENRRLWTLLATNVADKDNALPQSLRAQIFYLAEFTLHQTSKILTGDASVSTLVDINSAVMKGLRTSQSQK